MSKFKVGERVKVVANTVGHSFDDQTIVSIDYVYPDGTSYKAVDNTGEWWCMSDNDIEPIMARQIELGNTYDTKSGRYTCIYISGDQAWMSYNSGDGPYGPAYRWTLGGVPVDLAAGGDDYAVIWEPVVTTHNHVVYAHGESRKTEYKLVDGKVDWYSFKVTPL